MHANNVLETTLAKLARLSKPLGSCMPQPLGQGYLVQFGPDKLLERPELAAQVGNVCVNWNLMEHVLMTLYAFLMGDYMPQENEYLPPTHPVAYQVFDSLNAYRPRVELLEKLLTWRAEDAEVKEFKEIIKPKLNKRFAERSKVAHGLWGTCDAHPDALILAPTYGKQMVWKKQDFEDVSSRILEDRRRLSDLLVSLYNERRREP